MEWFLTNCVLLRAQKKMIWIFIKAETMANKKLQFFIFILTLFIFSSCSSSFKVVSDYDKENDFTKYKTYNYIPQPFDTVTMEPLVPLKRQRRIEAGIDLQLEKLGYRFSENPDFLVSFFVKITQETRQGGAYIGVGAPYMYSNSAYSAKYGTQYYSGNPYTYAGGSYGWAAARVSPSTYANGTLMIDIVDAKTAQLVWYSRASGEISTEPKNAQRTIDKACGEAFTRFMWKVE